jgi:hypothetical protein
MSFRHSSEQDLPPDEGISPSCGFGFSDFTIWIWIVKSKKSPDVSELFFWDAIVYAISFSASGIGGKNVSVMKFIR